MPDSTGAIDLNAGPPPNLESLSPETQEAVLRMAEENPPEDEEQRVPVTTAFVVVLTRSGETQIATLDVADRILLDIPQPTEDQIFGAAAVIQKDIAVGANARTTVEFQMQQARHMAEQAQAAAIAGGLDLSKMRS